MEDAWRNICLFHDHFSGDKKKKEIEKKRERNKRRRINW